MMHRTWWVGLFVVASAVDLAAQCELGTFGSGDFGPGSEPALSDRFGQSVDISGGVCVVGAPFNDEPGAFTSGAAYVYRWNGVTFAPEQKLLPGPLGSPSFGARVMLDDDVMLVAGGSGLTELAFDGASWNETTFLELDVPSTIAFAGDLVVLGHPFEDDNVGEARVFRRLPSGWTFEQTLPNPLGGVTDRFGSNVTVDGDLLAIGASGKGSAFGLSQGLGVVHIYRDGPGGWALEDSVSASDGLPDELFATQLAIDGDDLVVAATHSDEFAPGTTTLVGSAGALYVYRHDGAGTWNEQQMLTSNIVGVNANLGRSLDLDGDVIVAGSSAAVSGRVAVFHRRDGVWAETSGPVPANIGFQDDFGIAVAVSGERVATGSDGHDFPGAINAGSANVFDVHPVIDLGFGLAGFGGTFPQLGLSGGLCADDVTTLSLADAEPSSTAFLVFGVSLLETPFKGGTLVPSPDVIVPGLALTGVGTLALPFAWPSGVAGLETWWQVAVIDGAAPAGFALSNALTVTAAGL